MGNLLRRHRFERLALQAREQLAVLEEEHRRCGPQPDEVDDRRWWYARATKFERLAEQELMAELPFDD